MTKMNRLQYDQIGRFFKVSLLQMFLQKQPKYLPSFWAILKNVSFKVKTYVATFEQLLVCNWDNFYLASGHTDPPALMDHFSGRR